jgi:hypothetical protein
MKPDSQNWTKSRTALTGSQMKALLRVATDSGLQSEPLTSRAVELDAVLARLSSAHDGGSPDLLSRAADPTTSVEDLARIKELAKRMIASDADDREREAARLLYHVSVAAALVHHGASISGRPLHKQLPLYEQLAERWAGHAIGDVFRDAAAHARHG